MLTIPPGPSATGLPLTTCSSWPSSTKNVSVSVAVIARVAVGRERQLTDFHFVAPERFRVDEDTQRGPPGTHEHARRLSGLAIGGHSGHDMRRGQARNKRGRSKQQGLHGCDDVDDVPPKCCATRSIQRRCTSRWCTGLATSWPGSG